MRRDRDPPNDEGNLFRANGPRRCALPCRHHVDVARAGGRVPAVGGRADHRGDRRSGRDRPNEGWSERKQAKMRAREVVLSVRGRGREGCRIEIESR